MTAMNGRARSIGLAPSKHLGPRALSSFSTRPTANWKRLKMQWKGGGMTTYQGVPFGLLNKVSMRWCPAKVYSLEVSWGNHILASPQKTRKAFLNLRRVLSPLVQTVRFHMNGLSDAVVIVTGSIASSIISTAPWLVPSGSIMRALSRSPTTIDLPV